MAVTPPPKKVRRKISVGNTNLKGNSVNIRIYRVNVIATTSPTIVPSKPDAVINEKAS